MQNIFEYFMRTSNYYNNDKLHNVCNFAATIYFYFLKEPFDDVANIKRCIYEDNPLKS